MTVQQNIERVKTIRTQVTEHPMCRVINEDAHYFYIYFPPGDFAYDGLRATKSDGHAVALQKLLDEMECIWMESYP